jgi:hypothetical protein
MRPFGNSTILVQGILIIALVTAAGAASRTWTGADASGYWSAPANWSPAGPPQNGEELVFPGGLVSEDLVSTNDLIAGSFHAIRLEDPTGGHTIRGNAITLTNGITHTGRNMIACDLTLAAYQAFIGQTFTGWPDGRLTISGNINLGGGLLVDWGGLVISGLITGSGSIYIRHAGVALSANNSYTGVTTVWGANLHVNGVQPNSNIALTEGSLGGSGVVGDVTGDGVITPGPGLSAANVNVFGSFAIWLTGNNVSEYGKLVVRGGVGLSGMTLYPSLTFTPAEGSVFLIVDKTSPGPIDTFRGLPEGAVTNVNGTTLRVSYVGGDGNDVTLAVPYSPPRLAGTHVEAGNGNGRINQNECNHLFLGLANDSAIPITGIRATLNSLTPGAIVTQSESDFPNIPPAGTRTNLTPFQVRTTPQFPCGGSIDLVLRVTTDAHGTLLLPLSVPSQAEACPDGGGQCVNCFGSIPGTLQSDIVINRPLLRNLPTVCGSTSVCPGFVHPPGSYRYVVHTFTNLQPSDACVTVALGVSCPQLGGNTNQLQATAFLTAAPANVCSYYLGDTGRGIAGNASSFSFTVSAGAVFSVLVTEVGSMRGCDTYTLDVYGLPCPPPRLNIARGPDPTKVRLSWSSGYPAFHLQRTPSIDRPPPLPFSDVLAPPLVIGSDYMVTGVADANDEYFRLKKD